MAQSQIARISSLRKVRHSVTYHQGKCGVCLLQKGLAVEKKLEPRKENQSIRSLSGLDNDVQRRQLGCDIIVPT